MTELIFQKKLIFIRQINQNNVCFVIIGYFLDKNFSYGPYLCDGCYNMTQKSTGFKNIAIVHIKKSTYIIYFPCMNKYKAKKIITNFDLNDNMRSIMNCND